MQVSVIDADFLMTWLWPQDEEEVPSYITGTVHPPTPTRTHTHTYEAKARPPSGRETSCVLKVLTQTGDVLAVWLRRTISTWSQMDHVSAYNCVVQMVHSISFNLLLPCIQHDMFQADELHLPANECLLLGYTATLQMGANANLFKTASQVSWPKRCVIIMLYVILVPFWFVLTQKTKTTNWFSKLSSWRFFG